MISNSTEAKKSASFSRTIRRPSGDAMIRSEE